MKNGYIEINNKINNVLYVGALTGFNQGTINNISSDITLKVSGNESIVSGLVGHNESGKINNIVLNNNIVNKFNENNISALIGKMTVGNISNILVKNGTIAKYLIFEIESLGTEYDRSIEYVVDYTNNLVLSKNNSTLNCEIIKNLLTDFSYLKNIKNTYLRESNFIVAYKYNTNIAHLILNFNNQIFNVTTNLNNNSNPQDLVITVGGFGTGVINNFVIYNDLYNNLNFKSINYIDLNEESVVLNLVLI